MKKLVPFLVFWVIDILLLYVANSVYPTNFVLGNAYFSMFAAALVAGFFWTFLVWNSMPIATSLGLSEKKNLKMLVYYFLVNFVALWLVARFSTLLGFGVTNYLWVLGLAFVANFVQWGGWMISQKFTK